MFSYLFHRLFMTSFCTDYVAFADHTHIATGALAEVVRTAKRSADDHPQARVLLFHGPSSHVLDLDYHGTAEQVVQRAQAQYAPPATEASDPAPEETAPTPAGRGRPRLGVIAREVTLLPRHWEWLGRQPGGASVALRKLVEQARKAGEAADRIRQAQESCYRFMSTMAGDRVGFEEAARALFAGNATRFAELAAAWPPDIGAHLRSLAAGAFDPGHTTREGGSDA